MSNAPNAIFRPRDEWAQEVRDLWCYVAQNGLARSESRRALVVVGLDALDTALRAEAVVRAEGLVSHKHGAKMAHIHPAARLAQQSREQFARIWADRLNLSRNDIRP